ncbi:MAG: hypothetical protein ABIA76_01285 [Candidatus Diapherotrites archaeon]
MSYLNILIVMGVVTLTLKNETEARFRTAVEEKFGNEKGALGKAADEAFELWAKEQKQEFMRKRALESLKKGHPIGKLLYKHRSELHER